VLSGDLAASAWGAAIPVTPGAPPDLYLPPAGLRRAVRVAGERDYAHRAATLTAAPLSVFVQERFTQSLPTKPFGDWQLAHPVVVALDLALDRSRGREVLDDWAPPPEFTRVW